MHNYVEVVIEFGLGLKAAFVAREHSGINTQIGAPVHYLFSVSSELATLKWR